jgi:hypothetical protein
MRDEVVLSFAAFLCVRARFYFWVTGALMVRSAVVCAWVFAIADFRSNPARDGRQTHMDSFLPSRSRVWDWDWEPMATTRRKTATKITRRRVA